ncbi:MAG TPA: DUF465 domain-containing protein [Myxococcota bacterium]|nr:DUF465 domain-containing protein [Myxococcota bacterium]HOD08105.1 DUF465 domain-containing protein [Myxococcota bacterium]HPB51098.1 DUF465 domain-containing protein [Myxococcota bacterium]HQP95937.1 DUF465 domain-containing protein [Myxococcota bacterium]
MSADNCTEVQNTTEHLEVLRDEHRKLDSKIKELTSVSYLTAEEQMEVAQLKKKKLALKDEIFKLASILGIEP